MPFHVMQVEQIIGSLNGNTSAQAIQLRLRSSGQNQVQGSKLWAWNADNTQRTLLLDIVDPVSNSASGARVLLSTSAFNATMIAGGATNYIPDFTLANNIPFSYLAAGRLTFEDNSGTPTTPGTIYWSVAWGGASYTGSVTGDPFHTNDADGDFGKFGLGLLSPGIFAPGLVFTGSDTAPSTNNAADYVYTTNSPHPTVIKNSGTAFTVVPEPGNVALLAVGALGLGGFALARRRRARARA